MEPPAKVTKFEMESQYLEGEVMEEGQEEWLSEGILTDDDYNPGSQEAQADQNDSNVASSQDESIKSAEDSQNQLEDSQNQMEDSQSQPDVSSQNISNIEDTLNNLENSKTYNQTSDLPEELNAFLIRKVDGKVIGSDPPKKESDMDESVQQSDDDGNDTDDLLRVLGDGDQSSKHIQKEKVMIHSGDFSDGDDNFIFRGQSGDNLRKVKTYTAAKKALSRAPATKAEPEDDDLTDCSSDEAETFKKMFTYKNKELTSVTRQISTTVKPGNLTISPLEIKPEPKPQPKQSIIKKVVHITTMPTRSSVTEVKRPPSSPRRTYPNKRAGQASQTSQTSQASQKASQVASLLNTSSTVNKQPLNVKKPQSNVNKQQSNVNKQQSNLNKQQSNLNKQQSNFNKQQSNVIKQQSNVNKHQPNVNKQQSNVNKQQSNVNKQSINNSTMKKHQSESMNEEHLDDEKMEDSIKKPKESKSDQRLMHPEVMDEDVPTDEDSESDDESIYSELPSSESDCEDCFTLDLRTERAGDYIPLLGDKAYKLLSEERDRVKARLDTLKTSLAALSDSGRELADQLKDATNTVAELDAMLKAA